MSTQIRFNTTAFSTGLAAVAFLSFAGLLDAAYLTYKHFSGEYVGCAMQSGCDEVLNGPLSTIGDVPLALLGVIYYAGILLLCLVLRRFNLSPWNLGLVTSVGFLSSCYFLYLQLSVIKAICEYCVVSFAISSLIFLIAMIGSATATVRASRPD
jgi:uncharacterized membrane protein